MAGVVLKDRKAVHRLQPPSQQAAVRALCESMNDWICRIVNRKSSVPNGKPKLESDRPGYVVQSHRTPAILGVRSEL